MLLAHKIELRPMPEQVTYLKQACGARRHCYNQLLAHSKQVDQCKLGQQNPAHLDKASDQVRDGLAHLTQLFAPNRSDVQRVTFDRRY
jgi:hypothetical protein